MIVTTAPGMSSENAEAVVYIRREFLNFYPNWFTTTIPPVTMGDRQQYLLQREKFEDKTTIADATGKLGLAGFDLTSVSTFTNRGILVSHDASSLTGSGSVDQGCPMAGVLLPWPLHTPTVC